MSGHSGLGIRRLWALATLLALFGCVDSEEPRVEDGEQEAAFCSAFCGRGFECGQPGTTTTCESYCMSGGSAFASLRPEAMDIAASCIRDVPCASFFTEAEKGFPECWERAGRELEPTKATRRFCQAWSRRWFECGYSYPVEDCEASWSVDKAYYLERMSSCLEVDCEVLPDCPATIQESP